MGYAHARTEPGTKIEHCYKFNPVLPAPSRWASKRGAPPYQFDPLTRRAR